MAGSDPVLRVEGLYASYGAVQVLRSVDLAVERGEIVALLGTNGAGKSTILRCISGVMRPDAGRVFIDDEEITGMAPEDTVRRGICQVPGGRGLLPSLTIDENLRMGAYPIRKDKARVKAGFEKVYTAFPRLAERRTQAAGTMSGGEQRMLALARAFLAEPLVLLLDEPSLGLAPKVVDEVFAGIGRFRDSGTAVVLVEQYVHRSLALADHAVVLEGSAAAIASDPRVREAYLGE